MDFVALVSVVMVFGIPMTVIWTSHQRKMLEMKLQMQNQGDAGLRAEVEALRQEVRSLRDTSMQYDLSFDTALHQVEHRLKHLEKSQHHLQHSQTSAEAPTQNVTLGGRG